MRVEAIGTVSINISTADIDTVRANLDSLAKLHNVSVDELLQSAHSAGPAGLPYQVRALNLEARINRLQSQ